MSRAAYVRDMRDSVLRQDGDTFSRHVITQEGEGRWLFARPKTGMYHFRVIAAPGAVIVYGDIEDIILTPSDRDALHWLKSVLRGPPGQYDLSYVAEKVRGRKDIVEFQPRLLEEWAENEREAIQGEISWIKSHPTAKDVDEAEIERAKQRLDNLSDMNLDPGSADLAYQAICDFGEYDELPDLNGLTYGFMLQVFGLQCFCAALEKMEEHQDQKPEKTS